MYLMLEDVTFYFQFTWGVSLSGATICSVAADANYIHFVHLGNSCKPLTWEKIVNEVL
jgi:hypothetical protein